MLESHTRQTDTIDTITMKRARKNEKKRVNKRRQNRSAAFAQPSMKSLWTLNCLLSINTRPFFCLGFSDT